MRLEFFLSILLAPSVLAVGSFVNPSGKDGQTTYHTQQVVNVQWTGTAEYSSLSLGYYSETNATITWLISNSPNYPTRYSWTVSPIMDGFGLQQTNDFYLYVCNGTDFESPFTSPMFYITRPNNSDTPGPTSVQTPSPTSNAPHGTSTSGEGGTGNGKNSKGDSSGLSTGAKAGIGVGVGVGGLLVIGAIGFFFWRRRKHSKAATATPQAPPLEKKDQYNYAAEVPGTSPQMAPVEAPTNAPHDARSELGGSVRAELE